MKIQYLLLTVSFMVMVSCNTDKPVENKSIAEPVGIILSADGKLPAIEIAVELLPPMNPAVTAKSFSKIFSDARVKCVEKFTGIDSGGWSFSMSFQVIEKIVRVGTFDVGLDPLSACLQEQLADAPLDGFDQIARSGMVQARLGKAN